MSDSSAQMGLVKDLRRAHVFELLKYKTRAKGTPPCIPIAAESGYSGRSGTENQSPMLPNELSRTLAAGQGNFKFGCCQTWGALIFLLAMKKARMRWVGVMTVAMGLALCGCSSFNRDWTRLANVTRPDSLEGR